MFPSKPRILAIDDVPANLYTLGTALTGEFDLQIATSGSQGLAMAAESPPDLILLDVMMPEMDGLETCRRLRSQPKLDNVPIVFLTALSDTESEISGLDLGVADYISKPFHIDVVKLRIRNILRLTFLSRELQMSEERMRFVLEASGDGIWDWTLDSDVVLHNDALCRMLGLDSRSSQHERADFRERVHPEDRDVFESALDESVCNNAPFNVEYRVRHGDGHYFWVADVGKVVSRDGNGRATRMVGCLKNIDARKRSEEDVRRLALLDPLTELPNRRLLTDRLQQSMLRSKRSKAYGALYFLDMDKFKQLNDVYGHDRGDALLIQVAARLRGQIRAQDTVARLGGDEFVVLFDTVHPDPAMALEIATRIGEKLREALNIPYHLGDMDYRSTPSIGLTLFSGLEGSIDEILKRADEAMYQAKQAGRNQLRSVIERAPEA